MRTVTIDEWRSKVLRIVAKYTRSTTRFIDPLTWWLATLICAGLSDTQHNCTALGPNELIARLLDGTDMLPSLRHDSLNWDAFELPWRLAGMCCAMPDVGATVGELVQRVL